MKVAQLSGSTRTNVGKKDAAQLRKNGQVPCVIYGSGEQTHFSVKNVELEKLIFSPEVYQFELEVEGKKANAVVRELQQHPLTGKIQHVDFLELDDNKPVRVALPVRLTGSARGVMAGGKLLQSYRMLNVVGLPKDLPEAITLDISDLKIGDSIRVKSVEIPGLTILEPQASVVVGVRMARGAVKPEEEEEAEAEAEA
ncbi:MAG: 50S ribosomal protein L25 [Crocinitomicaceae bacterium]